MQTPNIQIGDFVHDHIIWEDTPDYRIDLTRISETEVRTDIYCKTMEAVMAVNAAEAANFSRTQKLGEIEKVASIPSGLYYELKSRGIADDPERLAAFLNNPDFAKFRSNNMWV